MAKSSKRGDVGAPGSGASALPISKSAGAARDDIAALIATLPGLDPAALNLCWRNYLGGAIPAHLPKWLLARVLA